MFPAFIYLGTCLELLGASLALDVYAEMPWAPDGISGVPWTAPPGYCNDPAAPCSRTLIGSPIQYGDETECFFPAYFDQPFYDEYWCQSVSVEDANGVAVNVTTMCASDPNVVPAYAAPYKIRVMWAREVCSEFFEGLGWCTPENVCTAQDKINGDCTCTAAEQANNECTP